MNYRSNKEQWEKENNMKVAIINRQPVKMTIKELCEKISSEEEKEKKER